MFTTSKKHKGLFLPAFLFMAMFLFLGCNAEREDDPAPFTAVSEENIGPNPYSIQHNRMLFGIRRATVRYHRIEEAIADGYVQFSPCISHPELGGMGYHYVNPGLLDGELNYLQPEALLYEPMNNGRMQLVGVEYIINADMWAQNNPPTLGDQAFDVYIDSDANPLPFDNYQLHAWVWKHNPSGMHAPFNPRVSCK